MIGGKLPDMDDLRSKSIAELQELLDETVTTERLSIMHLDNLRDFTGLTRDELKSRLVQAQQISLLLSEQKHMVRLVMEELLRRQAQGGDCG